MQGDPRIIDLLNQYFIHSRMCKNWGYAILEKVHYDEAIEEMRHADLVIQRILFLEGVPNLADYDRILVGATPREQLDNDLALEHAALSVLRPGVALTLEIGDHATRDLLEGIIVDEEHHIDWIEAQRHKIAEVGDQQYLPQQIYA